MLEAVDGKSRRLKSPPLSPVEIAQLFADGASAPKFGTELREAAGEISNAPAMKAFALPDTATPSSNDR